MGGELLEIVRLLKTSTAVPLWVMTIALVATLIKVVPALVARLNDRRKIELEAEAAAEVRTADLAAQHYDRLQREIDRLGERIEALEDKVKDCEADRDSWRIRALEAEARANRLETYQLAVGEARQAAANIVAVERLSDDHDKKGQR